MAKTKIEWCDYTINPVKGICPMACPYCYARRMYKRFKWNPEITMPYSLWDDVKGMKPSKIFIGSTMELFGEWIKPEWMRDIFETVKAFPYHTFIFLTKKPENLIKWSPFPENCWVGFSATDRGMFHRGLINLIKTEAKVKFVSFEPLFENISGSISNPFDTEIHGIEHLDWVIIGQQTPVSKRTQPKIEWVQEIVGACDKANVPVFLKNNLSKLPLDIDTVLKCTSLAKEFIFKDQEKGIVTLSGLRQEFPKE